MINDKTEKDKWQFMFLGANIDATHEAESIGISKEFASSYNADSQGTVKLYDTLCETVSMYRECGEIESDWNCNLR